MSPARALFAAVRAGRQAGRLTRLRARLEQSPSGTVVTYAGLRIEHRSGIELYMQLKDILIRGIYRFECQRPDPLVIDGGANIGISAIATKLQHPGARVIAYEPDPELAAVLRRNLNRNHITGVRVVEAALAARAGEIRFTVDGVAGRRDEAGSRVVRAVRLADEIAESVDFLKLNIEGEELPVLEDLAASGALARVACLVVEYHGWAGSEQRLGRLLDLLDRASFRYLVHDFDEESCATTKPPFLLRPRANWFCLVHGARLS